VESAGLEEAVEFAKENHQIGVWDRAERPWAMAVYDARKKELRPLSDEEAGLLLNGDPLIRKEWARWNAMSQNRGSLIVLDAERVWRVLSEAHEEPEGEEDVRGLA
jgi:hypothetical protein